MIGTFLRVELWTIPERGHLVVLTDGDWCETFGPFEKLKAAKKKMHQLERGLQSQLGATRVHRQ